MDDVFAVMSSLVQTKSIEQSLAPAISQVSKLVLYHEAFENGDEEAFPPNLEERAEAVTAKSELLLDAGRKFITTTDDLEFRNQMSRACESLGAAAESFVIAAQRLYLEKYSYASRRHIVRAAKDVVESTLKVLLVTDNAELKIVVDHSRAVIHCLKQLMTIQNMTDLVPIFKTFSDAVLQFSRKVEKRQSDLIECSQREAVMASLHSLKKSLPMLSSALQTCIKYPQSVQAQTNKEMAMGQILQHVETITSLLQNRHIVTSHDDIDKPGSFILTLDKVLDELSESRRVKAAAADSDLDRHISALIRHCMAVAHFSVESQRKSIISSCQVILQQRSQLSSLIMTVESRPEIMDLQREFNESCNHLVCQVKKCEEVMSRHVVHLAVDMLKESTEPLERYVRAALTQPHMPEALLEKYKSDHLSHADAVCQIGSLVAAGCPHSKQVLELKGCISHLEGLDPELLPAISACTQSDQGTHNNSGATQHLKMLKKEWGINVDLLICCIDNIIDHQLFLEISESRLRDQIRRCRLSKTLNLDTLTNTTRAVVGISRRLSAVARIAADKHEDTLERHATKQAINAFKSNIQEYKGAASKTLSEQARDEDHEILQQQCDSLLASWSRVVSIMSRDQDSTLHNCCDVNPKLSSSPNEDSTQEKVENSYESQSKLARHKNLTGFVPLSSQVSLHGLMLNGQSWNGKSTPLKEVPSTNGTVTNDNFVRKDHQHELVGTFAQKYTSVAVSGHREQLELLSNLLLKWTNHASMAVKDVLPLISNTKLKSLLEELGKTVSSKASDSMQCASKLIDCDTSYLEKLHETTKEWATMVSNMLGEVDKLVAKWKVFSDKVASSAKAGNTKLLSAQLTLLAKHVRSTKEIGQSAQSLCITCCNVSTMRQSDLCATKCAHLEAITDKLQALQHSGDNDASDLDILSRNWAVSVYTVMRASQLASYTQISYLRGKSSSDTDVHDAIALKQELNDYSQDSIRIRALVVEIEESYKDASLRDPADQLEKALLHMQDCYDVIANVVSGAKQHDKMYAPTNMLLLKWSWCKKMEKIFHRVDTITGQTHSIINSSDQELKNQVSRIKTKTMAAIKPCHATDLKQNISQTLQQFEIIANQLPTLKASRSERVRVRCMQQRWAILCHSLTSQISDLNTVNASAFNELKRMLVTPDQASTSEHDGGKYENNPVVENTTRPKKDSEVQPQENHPSKDKGRPHSYIPASKQQSNANDLNWRELKKGPQNQHSTPQTPKATSSNLSFLRKTPQQSHEHRLPPELDRWTDEGNPIIQIARRIATEVSEMEAYLKGRGHLQSFAEVVITAKSVAVDAEQLVKFSRILVDHSIDKRCAENLAHHVNKTPMMIAQLHILSSGSSVENRSDPQGGGNEEQTSARMLVNTARNVVTAFRAMLVAAEAVCVKGLRSPAKDARDETEAVVLATQWKLKIGQHRSITTANALKDELGLRRVTNTTKAPALNHIMAKHT